MKSKTHSLQTRMPRVLLDRVQSPLVFKMTPSAFRAACRKQKRGPA